MNSPSMCLIRRTGKPRRRSWFGAISILLCLVSNAVSAQNSLLPRAAVSADSGEYTWLNERALEEMLSGGEPVLRGRRVGYADWFLSAVAEAKAGKRDRCIPSLPMPVAGEIEGINNVFERTVAYASVIVRGTVVEAESGLFAGRPGVMLVVKPSTWIRRHSGEYRGDHLAVFYPAPVVSLVGRSFCSSRDWPDYPRVGAEVLVLGAGPDLGTFRGMPHAPAGPRGIIYGDDGGARMHQALAAADGVRANASFNWVVRHVTEIARAQEKR